jgi:hypothetical protein
MHFSAQVIVVIALFISSLVAASITRPHRTVNKYDGETNGKYIVTLKADSGIHVASVVSHPGITEKVEYSNFNAFSGNMSFL